MRRPRFGFSKTLINNALRFIGCVGILPMPRTLIKMRSVHYHVDCAAVQSAAYILNCIVRKCTKRIRPVPMLGMTIHAVSRERNTLNSG